MHFPLDLSTISFPSGAIELFIPDPVAVETSFRLQPDSIDSRSLPYWARVWPAALAMAAFLKANPGLYQGRKVLELAAGLGLPSLVAASLAAKVVASDIDPQAVATIRKSIEHLGFENVTAEVLDWAQLPESPVADLVIMSDVNYAPPAFTTLQASIHRLLAAGCTIILSTPQRLMAKDFITGLQKDCSRQETIDVWHFDKSVSITILQLDPPNRRTHP